jgi:amino-acid N-acetyltransferase
VGRFVTERFLIITHSAGTDAHDLTAERPGRSSCVVNLPIHRSPTRVAAEGLLKAAALPTADLTDAHMKDFFYCGPSASPVGLVGIEMCGDCALLRSLAVAEASRSGGLGRALVARAEDHARASGARSLYLLTTTAESFFRRLGYLTASRDSAPPAIRQSREFADLCPASSAFMIKHL